jgi:hypothetical protein
MMDSAVMPRQGDLDGRGYLSERTLIEFVACFLRVCLDQVSFMSRLKDADGLDRVRLGDLDARYLRNPEAREMVGFAEASSRRPTASCRLARGTSRHCGRKR